MAKIYNSELTKGLQKNAGIQQNRDKTPDELAEKVVPVIETNPMLLKTCDVVKRASAFNSTSASIYLTPSDRDFYLTGVTLSVVKDATATSTSSQITAPLPDGTVSAILSIAGLTTTIQDQTQSLTIDPPLRIRRGVNINVTNSTANANVIANGTIVGFLADPAG